MSEDHDWFTTAVNEAKARVAQWPPGLQQVASASLPSLEQQLAHEKHQAERIAELERVIAHKDALLRECRGHLRGYKMSMLARTPERLIAAIDATVKDQDNAR